MRRPARILLNAVTVMSLVLCIAMVVLVGSGAENTIVWEHRFANGHEVWITGKYATWVGPPNTPVAASGLTTYPTRLSIYYVGGIMLTAVLPVLRGIALLIWLAVRPLPATTNPRCPHCGYDLRATPTRCPECGTIPATPSGQ